MKNLSNFKERLKIGVKMETINHNNGNHGNMGIRAISKVQTNSFALSTEKKDGSVFDSWCEYPNAKYFEVVDENTVNIFWDNGNGNKRELILTYKFI